MNSESLPKTKVCRLDSPDSNQALHDIFYDLYGVPFGMAQQLAQWNLFGWKERLEQFEELIKKPVEQGEIEIS